MSLLFNTPEGCATGVGFNTAIPGLAFTALTHFTAGSSTTTFCLAERIDMDIGVDTGVAADLKSEHAIATQRWQASFLLHPLAHPRHRRDARKPCVEQWARSDLVLDSAKWGQQIVGKLSPWLQLDSAHLAIRQQSEAAFKQELAWAAHLTLTAVQVPPPGLDCVNYARCINQVLQATQHLQIWVRVPLQAPAASAVRAVGAADGADAGDADGASLAESDAAASGGGGGWLAWHRLRSLCEQHPNLGVALEIGLDLCDDEQEVARWCGEPLRAVILPTSIFITNKRGYPTLSRKHQTLLLRLVSFRPRLIVRGRADSHEEGLGAHVQYLRYLVQKNVHQSEVEHFERPYYDYLQAPLQPLQDNLESQTYEVFERDPVKYKQYEAATALALRDRRAKLDEDAVVMVVGAGRGPLVAAALAAARTVGQRIRLFAVEKNPNALVTLHSRKANEAEWADVTIIASDMRDWQSPQLADILVSELLGSWGDNELSPECLDGAQAYLKPGGISIPTDYTSFVAPLSSSRLWNETKNYKDLAHFETPYVVKVHNAFQMAEAQPLFVFSHPTAEPNPDNERYKRLVFDVPLGGALHGFVGFFHSTLYKDIHISTEPHTLSEGMFSWFPLYVPLRHPALVPDGGTVEAHFWRHTSARKVWYEWALAQPVTSPIHNPNGRSYHIGL
jgi:protein arginine N-methyltransferase 5